MPTESCVLHSAVHSPWKTGWMQYSSISSLRKHTSGPGCFVQAFTLTMLTAKEQEQKYLAICYKQILMPAPTGLNSSLCRTMHACHWMSIAQALHAQQVFDGTLLCCRQVLAWRHAAQLERLGYNSTMQHADAVEQVRPCSWQPFSAIACMQVNGRKQYCKVQGFCYIWLDSVASVTDRQMCLNGLAGGGQVNVLLPLGCDSSESWAAKALLLLLRKLD